MEVCFRRNPSHAGWPPNDCGVPPSEGHGADPLETGEQVASPRNAGNKFKPAKLGWSQIRFGAENEPNVAEIHPLCLSCTSCSMNYVVICPSSALTGGRHEEGCISLGVGGRWLEPGRLL